MLGASPAPAVANAGRSGHAGRVMFLGPAGVGDLLMGLLAPLVARNLYRRESRSRGSWRGFTALSGLVGFAITTT